MGMAKHHGSILTDGTFWTYLIFQAAMVVLYALFCQYTEPIVDGEDETVNNSSRYPMY